jgi:hypothetical protein
MAFGAIRNGGLNWSPMGPGSGEGKRTSVPTSIVGLFLRSPSGPGIFERAMVRFPHRSDRNRVNRRDHGRIRTAWSKARKWIERPSVPPTRTSILGRLVSDGPKDWEPQGLALTAIRPSLAWRFSSVRLTWRRMRRLHPSPHTPWSRTQ